MREPRPTAPIFVLGGFQTDFARNWTREGKAIADVMRAAVDGALAAAAIDASAIEVGHVGNFIGELLCDQGHLGGLLVEANPAFAGLPTARHEAACASGGVATLAAMADLESGRYDVACVVGVEVMRARSAFEAQAKLGVAAWTPREVEGVSHPWPKLFSDVADEYERRYGLRYEHLGAIAKNNFANARRNPTAQTRGWTLGPRAFAEDDAENPIVSGRTRKQDCSQVSDGGAAVILASERFAREHAKRRGIAFDRVARIAGWGHRTARMALADKLRAAEDEAYVMPHVRGAIRDAFARARVGGVADVDAIECHDCFTVTEYMAIDHFGLTLPGEAWRAIEEGTVLWGGAKPVNPSGGLIGAGHPVGASGVRMLLDASKQVTGGAGDYQVPNARRVATLNIGGSGTTTVTFVVERGEA
jgi:acetyl-CoA C-acetyltransferase